MISWLSYGHHIAGVLSRLRCKYMYVYKYMFFDSDLTILKVCIVL